MEGNSSDQYESSHKRDMFSHKHNLDSHRGIHTNERFGIRIYHLKVI